MPKPVPQAGVLPVRDGQVCLVTSRSTGRWVIPKGHVDPGHTAPQAATIEAWEEAGLTGTLDPTPLGAYEYKKYGHPYRVTVYLMTDVTAAADWPERGERDREWLPPEDAAGRVAEPGLRALLREAAGRLAVGA